MAVLFFLRISIIEYKLLLDHFYTKMRLKVDQIKYKFILRNHFVSSITLSFSYLDSIPNK